MSLKTIYSGGAHMKNFKKAMFIMLLIITLLSISQFYVIANTVKCDELERIPFDLTATTRDCKNFVSIHKEPSNNSEILGEIPCDDFFLIRNQVEKWIEVNYNGIIGYVDWKYVKIIESNPEDTSYLLGNSILYYKSSLNRDNNISVACSIINGTVLEPGEYFTWSKIVGKTTFEKGFLPAPVIVNSKVTTGLGGGVCQVSSALYNAVLDTSIKTIEAHHHSIGCAYTNNDATVAYGSKDFIFCNTYDFPIEIQAFSFKGIVFVDICEYLED